MPKLKIEAPIKLDPDGRQEMAKLIVAMTNLDYRLDDSEAANYANARLKGAVGYMRKLYGLQGGWDYMEEFELAQETDADRAERNKKGLTVKQFAIQKRMEA